MPTYIVIGCIGDVRYMFGEHHYMGSEIFTTLLHYYVVTELCGEVHHKGSDHHFLVFTVHVA